MKRLASKKYTNAKCFVCGTSDLLIFYEVKNIPVHSVQLIRTREEALGCKKGDIALGYCRECGHISNVLFDPSLLSYSEDCEENQAFSSRFSAFHKELANRLIEKYELFNKDIIEIGCGKGDFLTLLCELGQNRGVGFDPAYVHGRSAGKPSKQVEFIRDHYSENYFHYKADFVCCKMTLEHIGTPVDFVRMIRSALDDRPDTTLFFQVPDAVRILKETAFWDVYYEHCSYFSESSLIRLLNRCGFDAIDQWQGYESQYLMITARPGRLEQVKSKNKTSAAEKFDHPAKAFKEDVSEQVDGWKNRLDNLKKNKKRAVICGGGSKAVSFLNTLSADMGIEYVVDINPHKRNTYIPGTGQKVVGNEFLKTYIPDTAIIMNPVYWDEIKTDFKKMGLEPEFVVAGRP